MQNHPRRYRHSCSASPGLCPFDSKDEGVNAHAGLCEIRGNLRCILVCKPKRPTSFRCLVENPVECRTGKDYT